MKRFAEAVLVGFGEVREGDLLEHQLLFEQGVHHDRRGPRILDTFDLVQFVDQGGSSHDQRVG